MREKKGSELAVADEEGAGVGAGGVEVGGGAGGLRAGNRGEHGKGKEDEARWGVCAGTEGHEVFLCRQRNGEWGIWEGNFGNGR
jgi:hypothetical protein